MTMSSPRGSPDAGRPVSRRTVLGGAAAAGAAAVAGSVFGAGARAAGRPALQHGVIQLVFETNLQNVSFTPQYAQLIQQSLFEPYFYPKFPGVRVTALANGEGQAGQFIAESIAGVGPDVLSGCCTDFPTFQAAGQLVNVSPLAQRDNLDLQTIFSKGHLAALTMPEGVLALPAYDGPQVMYVNEGLLDELGVSYPEPGWTIDEAVKIWSSASGRDAKADGGWRYGATLQWYAGNAGWGGYWLPPGWGGDWINAARTQPQFDTPACQQAFRWITNLMADKVVLPRSGSPLGYMDTTDVTNRVSCMFMCGSWNLGAIATSAAGIKWNFYPVPLFPSGATTMVNVDFLALNAASKHQELAWELLKFVGISPQYQQFNIRTSLITPSRVDSWPFWEAAVQQVAPPLRGKNLHYYHDAVNFAHGHVYFTTAAVQANNLISQWAGTVPPTGRADVATSLQQLQKQLVATIANGAAYAAAEAKAEQQLIKEITGTKVGPNSNYSPPPVSGAGVPASDGSKYIVAGHGGSYTMLGDGWDVYLSSDNCTFACLPTTATEGEWSCRVTGITNLTCQSGGKPLLSVWCKVGLMAASDLSDDPVFASPHITGANQIEWQYRSLSGQTPGGQSGLVPAGVTNLMSDVTKPVANFLLAPVWLKLQRKGAIWTAYGSMDGKNWTVLGQPGVAPMGGAWIGIMATAHNGDFGNKGYIRATLDNLSFTPTHLMQIGKNGTPPAGGPVPSNWATATPAGL